MFKNFKRIFKVLINKNKLHIGIVLTTTLMKGIIPTISIYLMQVLINKLSDEKNDLTYLLNILLLYILIDIIYSLINTINIYCSNKLQMNISLEINMRILNKTKKLSLKHFEDSETYNKIKRAQNESDARIYEYFMLYVQVIQNTITLVSTSFLLLTWRWWAIIVVMISPIISSLLMARFSKKQYNIYMERTTLERKKWYIGYLLTNDIAFKEIKIYNLSDYFKNLYKTISEGFIKQDISLVKERSICFFLVQIIEELLLAFLIVKIIVSTFLKEIMVGSTMAYIRCISSIKGNVESVLQNIISIYENSLYVEQIFAFLDMKIPNEIKQEDIVLDDIETIEIKDLSFKYNNSETYALKDVNLYLEKSDMVAIVGKNGSGKSTLVKLISGLYDEYEGDILINNISLRNINKERLRELIGIVYQDFTKYELTLRENIALGKVENMNDDEKILRSLNQANGMNIIKKIENGLESQLGFWFEEGSQLSGGEWQKIALSRAFIRDAKLYVLDEPSSALDPTAEIEVLDKYSKLINNKIGVMVTHKINNISNISNKIVILEKGRVINVGTHEKLLEECDIYKKLYYISRKGVEC